MEEPVIRGATESDLPFMREMLYEASFAMDEPQPPPEAIEEPAVIRYIAGWGKAGDQALIAEVQTRPVGAAWYRLFPASDPGYGFVDADTPEVSIAVVPDFRGRGIGKSLLSELVEVASRDGFRALSLSVAPSNVPAIRLYERCGFEVVAVDDGLTMRASTE